MTRESGERGQAEERILAAARKRFESFGYRRTSMAEIARDAGIAVGTVYRYFPGKEQLFIEVVSRMNAGWLRRAAEVVHGPGSGLERFIRLGLASVEYNRENKLLQSVLNRDPEILPPPVSEKLSAEMLRGNVAIIAENIKVGIEDGSIRPVDPERAAFVLFSFGRTLYTQEEYPYDEVLPIYIELVLKGLTSDSR